MVATPVIFSNNLFRQLKVAKSIFAYSLCILSMIVNIAKISRAHLHYDVRVTSEEIHSFILVVNIRV